MDESQREVSNKILQSSEICNKIWKNIKEKNDSSKAIRRSHIVDEFYEQNGITYNFKMIKKDSTTQKEIQILKKPQDRRDPFVPPIEEGILVDEDISKYHRLLFNKFSITECHVILATKELVDQYTHLTASDFFYLLLVTKSLKGFGFFNGGMNAGASQPHKHMQSMPNLPNSDFGIFKLINEGRFLNKASLEVDQNVAIPFTVSVFEFPHFLMKFSEQFVQSVAGLTYEDEETIGKALRNIYLVVLAELGLFDDHEKILKDYSMVMTEEWMLVVPRISHEVVLQNGVLNLNSACYTLSILIKTEELKEEIKSMNVCDVLKRMSIK